MNMAFLASLIAFMLILSVIIKRQNKLTRKQEESFWAREARANSVRRKSLDGLDYIQIPLESFPTSIRPWRH